MVIVWIIILLVISAFCSATETAFSSCNRIRLRKLADDGSKSAKKALKVCNDFDKALTAILIGNNVVNIASSALATLFFTEKFGAGSVGVATLVMTVLVLIFGEIIPKSLAKEHSESFASFMAAPLSVIMFLLTPLIIIFTGIKKLVSLLAGAKEEEEPSVTEEELKYIIDEIEDEGVLEEEESELVRSALDFDEITIGRILVPRVSVAAAEVGDDIEEIKELFLKSRYSRLPIYDKDIDHIIGVIHQSDFFEMYISPGEKDIKGIITEPIYITENQRISEALSLMQKEKVHMAVVIDQYGGTAGICTLEDIIEELVGEIYDESDEEDTSFIKLSDNKFDVSGELSVADFIDRAELPDGVIDTEMQSMGGYVMELLDRIPEQGEELTEGRLRMSVTMIDEQKIGRIEITLLEEDPEKKEE